MSVKTTLAPIESRQQIGPDKLLGISTHNQEQAAKAVANGADYLGAGPTFPSSTKAFQAFPGLEFLNQVSAVKIPVFAIGGIDVQNVDEVLATGIQRIAVSNAGRWGRQHYPRSSRIECQITLVKRGSRIWGRFVMSVGTAICLLMATSVVFGEAEITYSKAEKLCDLNFDVVKESSGLAVSRVRSNLFWTHNDSGDKPDFMRSTIRAS